jgi:hypothetical protein
MTKEKELEKDQIILQNNIHKLISSYIRPNEPESLLMISGTLFAISMQLYTAMYKSDEVIKDILETAKESLPDIRESIHKELHTLTLH